MPHIYSMEIEQIPFQKVTVLKFPNFFICRELFFSSVNRWKIVGWMRNMRERLFFVLAEADCLRPILVTRWRLRVKVNRLRVYIRKAVGDASELPVEGAKTWYMLWQCRTRDMPSVQSRCEPREALQVFHHVSQRLNSSCRVQRMLTFSLIAFSLKIHLSHNKKNSMYVQEGLVIRPCTKSP